MEGGLLIGRFGLVLNEVYITDPEFKAPGGLYVYLWVCGVDIKFDFISNCSVNTLLK